MIDSRAIIDPKARIGTQVSIGPFTIIGPDVEIGEGTHIGSHVVIKGPTRIGRNNHIFQFSSIGEDSQDKKYTGGRATLEIGDENTIREFCTLNRGTSEEQGTRIGNRNLLLAYVHIAHDCIVGNETIFSNNAALAGHVQVDDYVGLGGYTGVYQFCHLGKYSFISGGSMVIKDVPPFVKVAGVYAKPVGLNLEGLRRRAFTPDQIAALKEGYNIIYRRGLTVDEAIGHLKELIEKCPDIQSYIDFLNTSTRGIVR